jgi:dipeptide/tripeptide permease
MVELEFLIERSPTPNPQRQALNPFYVMVGSAAIELLCVHYL